ncbi:MAG TPA: hypothetical protein VF818_08030 [Ktedonobacterales bacterium]
MHWARRLRQGGARAHGLALCALAGMVALGGCGSANTAQGFSDTGQVVMIVIAHQPLYAQPNCTTQTNVVLDAGATVIDLGTKGTNCEEIVYVQNGTYTGVGYLPVYGMRRAAGGVRCRAEVPCHLRDGPGTDFAITGAIWPGGSAEGYGTSRTGAIITDGDNFDWWEVIDPGSGQRADVFGPNCQAF